MPRTLTPADIFSNFPQVPARNDPSYPADDLAAIFQSILNRTEFLNRRVSPVVTPQMYGAVGDGVADDTIPMQNWLNDAGARGLIAFLPGVPTYYRTTETLYENTGNVTILGQGALGSVIRLDAPGDDEDVFVVTTPTNNGRAAAGRCEGIQFQTSLNRGGRAGLVVIGVKHYRVAHCYASNVEIGFDLRNNCYGSEFHHITTADSSVRCGLLLRGSFSNMAGSGSDIPVTNAWLGATHCALWIEGGAGGYQIREGQLMGGGIMASVQEANASMNVGMTYDPVTTVATLTATGATVLPLVSVSNMASAGSVVIGGKLYPYSGRDTVANTLTGVEGITADIPAGAEVRVVNTVRSVNLTGVSFEGTNNRHMVRTWCFYQGLVFHGCSFNSTSGSKPAISVLKSQRAGDYQAAFYSCGVQGTFSGANPLDISTHFTSGFHVEERNTWGTATFNAVSQNYARRPMVYFSGLSRSASSFENKIGFGGRFLRWNAGVLESNTDPDATTGWVVV